MSPGIAVVGEGADAATFREIVEAAGHATLVETDPARPGHGPAVSGVIVAEPVATRVIERSLHAGCHVLAMPPMSSGPAASETLQTLAEESGLTLQVGFPARFARPTFIARDLIESSIGEPMFVRVERATDEPPRAAMLLRQGLLHEIDLVTFLTGQQVVRVRAVLDGGDTSGLVQLETSGLFALIDIGEAHADGPIVEILGTEGSLIVDRRYGGSLQRVSVDGAEVVEGTQMVDIRWGGLSALAADFVAQIRGVAPMRTESDTHALSVSRAVWQSISTGHSVLVDEAHEHAR